MKEKSMTTFSALDFSATAPCSDGQTASILVRQNGRQNRLAAEKNCFSTKLQITARQNASVQNGSLSYVFWIACRFTRSFVARYRVSFQSEEHAQPSGLRRLAAEPPTLKTIELIDWLSMTVESLARLILASNLRKSQNQIWPVSLVVKYVPQQRQSDLANQSRYSVSSWVGSLPRVCCQMRELMKLDYEHR